MKGGQQQRSTGIRRWHRGFSRRQGSCRCAAGVMWPATCSRPRTAAFLGPIRPSSPGQWVGPHKGDLQRGQMHDMGDAIGGDSLLKGGGIGNVAVDEVDLRQSGVVHDQAQAMRLAGQVIGPDRDALGDQPLDRPSPNATERARHQKFFSHVSPR